MLVLQLNVYVTEESRKRMEITGSEFQIDFTIIEPAFSKTDKKASTYFLRVREKEPRSDFYLHQFCCSLVFMYMPEPGLPRRYPQVTFM